MAIRDSVSQFNKEMTKLNTERMLKEKRGEKIDEGYFEKQQAEIEQRFQSGILTREHFKLAVRQSRQSVSETDVKRYEAFKQQFCDASQGGYASNPKVAQFDFKDDFKGVPTPAPAAPSAQLNPKPEPKAEPPSKRGLPKANDDEFF